MKDDTELLQQYADHGAEEAFAELVRRHVNLVYSAALRQLNGDAHLAADATQIVFSDLARKAGAVAGHRVLAGWLFTSTRFAAAKLVRTERRRQAREQEAQRMQALFQDDPAARLDWQRVRPVLDEALGELGAGDREAILLRFFEGRDFAAVGARLNVADNTARMRVERALEKLRARLERRGVTSTSAALAMALAQQAVAAAPAGLAATVTGAALAGGGAAAAGGAWGFATFMSMTKLQLGVSGALAVAGATAFVLQAEGTSALQDEVAALRRENTAVAALRAENLRLARQAAEVAEWRRDDAELARLQTEAGTLATRLQQIARTEAARPPAVAVERPVLDQAPRPVFQARPEYPVELRNSGVTGEVIVDFVVDAGGNVKEARALRSSHAGFEAAAVAAVGEWKFAAARKGGREVSTRLQVPVVFGIKGAAPGTGASLSEEQRGAAGVTTVLLTPFTVIWTPPAGGK